MRPAHLLLAVAGLAAFGLGGAALAAGAMGLRIERVERELAAEFVELRARGVLAQPPAPESDALRAARGVLARLLEDVTPDGSEHALFGTPGMIRSVTLAELGRGLELREDWYAALDALPEALWSAASEPRPLEGTGRTRDEARRPSDSLGALREATNHLCARAWYVAHDPRRTAEAGHWLARGIALARVTDSGSHMDLLLRVVMEQILLDRAERIAELEGLDKELLLRDVRRELARGDERERLALVLQSDLRWLEHHFEVYRTRDLGAERLTEQRRVLEQVRDWRALLGSNLQARLPELAARLENRSLSDPCRLDHRVFASWHERGERIDRFLAGT